MKRLFKIGIIFLTLFSILVTILPLLNTDYFSMHDRQHVVRLFLLDTAMHQGYWYPRWVDGLGFGFGYALFNFYPPLVYYIAEAFRLVGFSYIWSIKLMIISGFLVSFTGMFLLLKRLTRNNLISLCAGQLYLLAQYHAELVYVRGAFAEFFAYNLLPWVFYGFYVLVEEKKSRWFALMFALLILAHPLVAFPFVLLFTIFFVLVWTSRKDKATIAFHTAVGGLWGLGISAFFWLPSMFERSFTLVDSVLTKQLADYKLHFVYIRQLFNSTWGYGGSIPGPSDGMSFEIGKMHVLLVTIGLGTILYFVYKKKRQLYKKSLFVIPFLLVGFVAVFMTLFKSQFIWDRIPLLWYMQFPWRFLVFVAFFTTVAGASWVIFLTKKVQTIGVVFCMVIALILYGPLFKPEKFVSGNDKTYLSDHQIKWEQSETSFEFMSKNIITSTYDNTVHFALSEQDLPKQLFELSSTGARGSIIEDTFMKKSFSITAHQETEFVLNRSYFPGWTALVDGQTAPMTYHQPVQTMAIRVPKGNHLVIFVFKDTPIRSVGWVITFLAVLLLFQPKKVYNALISKSRKAFNKS